MKAVRTIFALAYALILLAGFGFVAMLFYSSMNPPWDVVALIIWLLIAIRAGAFAFHYTMRRGSVALLSIRLFGQGSLTAYGESQISPAELVALFDQDKLHFELGLKVKIWGDWHNRKLSDAHELLSISYKKKERLLYFQFADDCELVVADPRHIFTSPTFIKVKKAKQVLWKIKNEEGGTEEYTYSFLGDRIETKSNTDWTPHPFDIGVGMHAVYLQG